ncbi:MAG TPA: hypothetical protein VNW72_00285 [Chthoniobacterales bacterium]|jgi:hypothetical protein|nr:hypothetical protein [Chthoniobacterales bacterium]
MKSPIHYGRLLILAAFLLAAGHLFARPIGFSELSLMVRMHESETDIKNDVAQRKLLHGLTQPQEGILKSQGASDSLIKSLRDSNLVASKEEATAAEATVSREHENTPQQQGPTNCPDRCIEVFDVAFGQSINLSRWGGLDYEVAFYSYRFAGEDHIQPAMIDNVGTKTVVYRSIPFESEGEVFTEDWYPTNGVRNWRYTPYNGSGGTLYNGRGDFRDTRSINFSDSVAVRSYSASRPIVIDWNAPVFIEGQPYTFYPVYSAGGVSLYFINGSSDSARVAVAFNR